MAENTSRFRMYDKAMLYAKAQAELHQLEEQGIRLAGNACAAVLFLKGDLSADERAGGALLAGADGDALRKSLNALGYDPTDWLAMACCSTAGHQLDSEQLRLALATLDPETVVALDDTAAHLLRDCYADELATQEDVHVSALEAGLIAHVLGMRFLNLGGFALSLDDPQRKQFMWACLKRIAPLGEPY